MEFLQRLCLYLPITILENQALISHILITSLILPKVLLILSGKWPIRPADEIYNAKLQNACRSTAWYHA